MANYQPVIPRAGGAFHIFQGALMDKAIANRESWGISEQELNPLIELRAKWDSAWAVTRNKGLRNSSQIVNKDEIREIYEGRLRPFIQRWIKLNPLLSDGDRESAGIRQSVKKTALQPVPLTVPLTQTRLLPGNQVEFYFSQQSGAEGCSKRAKPYGVKFCEIAYSIGSKPQSAEDCISILLTRSPHIVRFDMKKRGQIVYYYSRWVNSRGEGGAWANMKDFIIP